MSGDDEPCSSTDEENSKRGKRKWEDPELGIHLAAPRTNKESTVAGAAPMREKVGGNEASEAAKGPSRVALDFILIVMGIH